MLTSFFSKSKPINFTLVAVYMLIFYLLARFYRLDLTSFGSILEEVSVLLLYLLSLAVLNFIAKRNELTQRNAYKAMLFGAFYCMLVQALQNNDVIVANFFILLALRRIISLRTQLHTIKKIFDASLWIFVASLVYFWSILFLLLVFLGILFHVKQNFKYWLVPFLAFLTVFCLATCADLLLNDSFYGFQEWYQPSFFDFSGYSEIEILLPVSLLLALLLWCLFFYINILQKASANIRASHTLVLWSLLISLAVALLGPTKNSSELLFFLAPLAVVCTNYIQALEDNWFKELLLITIILVPPVLYIFL